MPETAKDFQLIDLIQESIETIIGLAGPESMGTYTYEEFSNQPFIQLGVDEYVYKIGQAAGLLSVGFVSTYTEIDWHRIAHEWNIPNKQLPTEMLWQIATVDIPKLRADIITMLTNMD